MTSVPENLLNYLVSILHTIHRQNVLVQINKQKPKTVKLTWKKQRTIGLLGRLEINGEKKKNTPKLYKNRTEIKLAENMGVDFALSKRNNTIYL